MTSAVSAARRRIAAAALAVLAVAELMAAGIYVSSDQPRHAFQVPAASSPVQEGQTGLGTYGPPAPAPSMSTTTTEMAPPGAVPAAAAGPGPAVGSASGSVASSPAPSVPRPVATTVPTPVSCQTDLSLTASPDRGYNFLCRQGSVPLTWATSTIRVYQRGLSPVQSAAFEAAVNQWESDAHFTVTQVTSAGAADVVFGTAKLASGHPGYTEDGYTTVSYRCAPRCAYDHAEVVLSSSARLSQTNWVSTVLHELGHVAGLNHVSQKAEVMYPFLTLSSPVIYASGDQAGFAVLAARRGA